MRPSSVSEAESGAEEEREDVKVIESKIKVAIEISISG